MSTISTHVLDVSLGRPASGIAVTLERIVPGASPVAVGTGVTDGDGRVRDLAASGDPMHAGVYQLRFETAVYFGGAVRETFYPSVIVQIRVADSSAHYHVPLLLSPFGYTTYRGS